MSLKRDGLHLSALRRAGAAGKSSEALNNATEQQSAADGRVKKTLIENPGNSRINTITGLRTGISNKDNP